MHGPVGRDGVQRAEPLKIHTEMLNNRVNEYSIVLNYPAPEHGWMPRATTETPIAPARSPVAGRPTALGMMVFVSLGWGCSFFLIRESLVVTGPFGVAFGRLAVAALLLGLLPAARASLPARAWPGILLLALTWMAVPLVLYPMAGLHINSATAGMINGAAPVVTAALAAAVNATPPRGLRIVGLAMGTVGILAIGLPEATSGDNAIVGAVLAFGAVISYSVAFIVAARLQREHGALPVIWRSTAVAAAALLPFGVWDLAHASPVPRGLVTLMLLGTVSTAACFAGFTWLAGNVGPVRASAVTYAVPVVALAVGVLAGGEAVAPVAVGGVVLVLAAAYLVQRPERPDVPATRSG
jgi:drug/metabolite transporter (DMT)-like permease